MIPAKLSRRPGRTVGASRSRPASPAGSPSSSSGVTTSSPRSRANSSTLRHHDAAHERRDPLHALAAPPALQASRLRRPGPRRRRPRRGAHQRRGRRRRLVDARRVLREVVARSWRGPGRGSRRRRGGTRSGRSGRRARGGAGRRSSGEPRPDLRERTGGAGRRPRSACTGTGVSLPSGVMRQ